MDKYLMFSPKFKLLIMMIYYSSGFLPNSDIGARDPISVYSDIGSDIGALFSSSDIGIPPISEYSGYLIT